MHVHTDTDINTLIDGHRHQFLPVSLLTSVHVDIHTLSINTYIKHLQAPLFY